MEAKDLATFRSLSRACDSTWHTTEKKPQVLFASAKMPREGELLFSTQMIVNLGRYDDSQWKLKRYEEECWEAIQNLAEDIESIYEEQVKVQLKAMESQESKQEKPKAKIKITLRPETRHSGTEIISGTMFAGNRRCYFRLKCFATYQ